MNEQQWLDMARDQQARFWSKVDRRSDDECWPWTAGTDKDGYGKFQVTGPRIAGSGNQQKHVRAHRLAWELRNGRIPDGMVLLHSCDNAACCNQSHLTPGTQRENRDDCIEKNRDAFGERHGCAKLTLDQVRAIREMRGDGRSLTEIAVAFGITKSHVWLVLNRTWGRVA